MPGTGRRTGHQGLWFLVHKAMRSSTLCWSRKPRVMPMLTWEWPGFPCQSPEPAPPLQQQPVAIVG